MLRPEHASATSRSVGLSVGEKKHGRGVRVRVISRTIHVQSRDLILVRTRQAQASLAKRARPAGLPTYSSSPHQHILHTAAVHVVPGNSSRNKLIMPDVFTPPLLHVRCARGSCAAQRGVISPWVA